MLGSPKVLPKRYVTFKCDVHGTLVNLSKSNSCFHSGPLLGPPELLLAALWPLWAAIGALLATRHAWGALGGSLGALGWSWAALVVLLAALGVLFRRRGISWGSVGHRPGLSWMRAGGQWGWDRHGPKPKPCAQAPGRLFFYMYNSYSLI